jgi:hypothetical protein
MTTFEDPSNGDNHNYNYNYNYNDRKVLMLILLLPLQNYFYDERCSLQIRIWRYLLQTCPSWLFLHELLLDEYGLCQPSCL